MGQDDGKRMPVRPCYFRSEGLACVETRQQGVGVYCVIRSVQEVATEIQGRTFVDGEVHSEEHEVASQKQPLRIVSASARDGKTDGPRTKNSEIAVAILRAMSDE